MCQNWLGNFHDVNEFLKHVRDRASARRRRDLDETRTPQNLRGTSGSAPFPEKRGVSDLCYAYNARDGRFYVGYSGHSGGMTCFNKTNEEYEPITFPSHGTEQSDRRQDRFEREINYNPKNPLNRPKCNCAEACALSIASSWNDDERAVLGDLVFVTFYPEEKGGGTKEPCPNCKTWITAARSYCDESGRFQCRNPDHDRDPGTGTGKEIRV